MRFGQFVTLSVFCRTLVFILVLALGGCELYLGDDTAPDDQPDAGEVIQVDATPDVQVPTPDAPVLEACSDVCAGEEYNEWRNPDGSCAYVICRPSYRHCACPVPLPTCVAMGCDGTQNIPLQCPDEGGPCFCAAPDGPDGWCTQ